MNEETTRDLSNNFLAAGNTPLVIDVLVKAVKDALKNFANSDQLLTKAVRQRGAASNLSQDQIDRRLADSAAAKEAEQPPSPSCVWTQRSVNRAILSMPLGQEIEYDERRNLALGLCGLMHGAGMLRVPKEILKASRLTPQ